ncbi:hypothetical protein LTR86_008841 [Recurvomyces mirabilis]|nr:hypothetical protein LTR86_008841 [Recurvomyces mirabilis]
MSSKTRSEMSREELRMHAENMLRAATAGRAGYLPTSAGLPLRSNPERGQLNSTANNLPRSMVDTSKEVYVPTAASLPSYRSRASDADERVLMRGSNSATSNDTARLRKLNLQREVDQANAATRARNTSGLFRDASSTDLLFLIDATNSMKPYIDSAKQQVRSIVSDIKEAFLNQAEVRVATVVYRDHNAEPNTEFLDFTTSVDEVWRFLDRIHTAWGKDFPEDVLGGVQQALNASWRQHTRCIIHIGDAPPHGSQLHDFAPKLDDYHVMGSEPHHLTHGPLLKGLIQLNINYALLRITSHTNRMALVWACAYGAGNGKLHPSNEYFSETGISAVKGLREGSSERRSATGVSPQFEELELGTTYSSIRHLVLGSVTSSFSRTVGRLSMALGSPDRSSGMRSPIRQAGNDFNAIQEEGHSSGSGHGSSSESSTQISLETDPPQWATPGWLDTTLEVQGFCPATLVHSASTLNDMLAGDEHIKLSVIDLTVKARSQAFNHGALRKASYARTTASTSHFVLKSFIREGHGRAYVIEDMRMQALCKAFALEFNSLVQIEPPLDFIVTSSLEKKRLQSTDRDTKYFSLEPFLDGDYVKYNDNFAGVNAELAEDPFNQSAQAFSHFTFERSFGNLLVNDLQGVNHLLTDPSIQTKDPMRFKLSETNLHEDGFKLFFTTHQCNSVCEKLELKTRKEMFMTGVFEYRERWPTMEPTVSCSNLYCRSILRLNNALQLMTSKTSWICMAPGPNHQFVVNQFYSESQGKLPPRKCPEHADRIRTGSSAAAIGGSLWARMRPPEPTGTISSRAW